MFAKAHKVFLLIRRELDLDKNLGLESITVSFNGVFRCTVVIKIGHVDQLHLNHAAHINLSMYFILVEGYLAANSGHCTKQGILTIKKYTFNHLI